MFNMPKFIWGLTSVGGVCTLHKQIFGFLGDNINILTFTTLHLLGVHVGSMRIHQSRIDDHFLASLLSHLDRDMW